MAFACFLKFIGHLGRLGRRWRFTFLGICRLLGLGRCWCLGIWRSIRALRNHYAVFVDKRRVYVETLCILGADLGVFNIIVRRQTKIEGLDGIGKLHRCRCKRSFLKNVKVACRLRELQTNHHHEMKDNSSNF